MHCFRSVYTGQREKRGTWLTLEQEEKLSRFADPEGQVLKQEGGENQMNKGGKNVI